jgi:hypothetical protein
MGRGSYEAIAGEPHWPYGGKPVHVLSRTLPPGADARVTAVHSSLARRGPSARRRRLRAGLPRRRSCRARMPRRRARRRTHPVAGAGAHRHRRAVDRAARRDLPSSTCAPRSFPVAWCKARGACRSTPARSHEARGSHPSGRGRQRGGSFPRRRGHNVRQAARRGSSRTLCTPAPHEPDEEFLPRQRGSWGSLEDGWRCEPRW